jgi:P27 family predicted phage terminase small subunit
MPAVRKSSSKKRLAGTDRKDRRPRADYASRLITPPPPPRTLPPQARPIWRQIAAAAVGICTLTRADLPLLELLVTTLHTEAEARRALAAEGMTTQTGTGGRKRHPAAALAEAARSQALAMLREFGLSPKARQTVDTAPPALAANPFLTRGAQQREDFDAFLASKPLTTPDEFQLSDPDLPAPQRTRPRSQ